MESWAPGCSREACNRRATARHSTSSTRDVLPDPLGPVTAVKTPKGNFTSRFFSVRWRMPFTSSQVSGSRRPCSFFCSRTASQARVLISTVGDTGFCLFKFFGRLVRRSCHLHDHCRTKVEAGVCRIHYVSIVFNNNNRIAKITQSDECLNKSVSITWMKANGWFIST